MSEAASLKQLARISGCKSEADATTLVDAVFTRPISLGLQFARSKSGHAEIVAIRDGMAAAHLRQLRPGLMLMGVNGRASRGLDHNSTMALLRTGERPLRLTFRSPSASEKLDTARAFVAKLRLENAKLLKDGSTYSEHIVELLESQAQLEEELHSWQMVGANAEFAVSTARAQVGEARDDLHQVEEALELYQSTEGLDELLDGAPTTSTTTATAAAAQSGTTRSTMDSTDTSNLLLEGRQFLEAQRVNSKSHIYDASQPVQLEVVRGKTAAAKVEMEWALRDAQSAATTVQAHAEAAVRSSREEVLAVVQEASRLRTESAAQLAAAEQRAKRVSSQSSSRMPPHLNVRPKPTFLELPELCRSIWLARIIMIPCHRSKNATTHGGRLRLGRR